MPYDVYMPFSDASLAITLHRGQRYSLSPTGSGYTAIYANFDNFNCWQYGPGNQGCPTQ